MPLTREGTNVREYKIPAIYEAETTQQVKDIPRPVENAHAFLGTTTDGRLYKFDASSSAADDNYGTLQPSDTSWTGRWKLMPYGTASGTGDFFNVKSFGATGDGTTDDSAAISAAIDAANGVGGGTVYFPYGTYRLLSTITSLNDRGVRLLGVYGDGLMSTGVGAVLVNDTGGSALNVNNAVVRGQSTVIERLAIVDGSTGGTYSIQLTGTYQVLVTNCAFETPLLLTSTRDTTIDRCYFTGTAGGYVQFSSAVIDTTIGDCNFDGSGGSSSVIASADAEITGLRIVNNQAVSLSGTFLGLTQTTKKVTNLHVEGNHITSVTGETVSASKALIDLAGSFSDAFDGASIENNYFNWDAATYTWGIKGAYVNNSTFSNNRFDTAAITADILLDSNSSNNYVVANGLTGSYSDAGTGNQFIDSSNALMGNKTQAYINDRQLSKAPVNGVYLDGVDDYINLGDQALLEFGDSSNDVAFSETFIFEIDDLTNEFPLSSKLTGSAPNNERSIQVLTNGKVEVKLYDSSTSVYIGQTGDSVLTTGRPYFVAVTYDGSGTSAGIKIYVGDAAESLTLTEAGSYTAMHAGSASAYLGRVSSTYGKGKIYSYVPWSRELSTTDIALLASDGNRVPVADQWGEAFSTVSDFSAGVDGFTAKNSATITGNVDSIGGEDDWLSIEATTNIAGAGKTTSKTFQVGRMFRVKGKFVTKAGNTTSDRLSIRNNSGFDIKSGGFVVTPGADDTVLEFDETFKLIQPVNELIFYLATSSGIASITSGDIGYIKDLQWGYAGAIASCQGRNLESDTWVDESSNELDGALTGATRLFEPKAQASGTFTPSLLFGGANTGMTYGNQTGYWRKLDEKTVYVEANITLTALGSSTGNATLAGMPFTSANRGQDHAVANVAAFNMTGLALGGVSGVVTYNGTDVKLYENSATGLATIDQTVFTATSAIRFSAVYEIA